MSKVKKQYLIYTIGHSTRSLDELFDLLYENDVECLFDIRAYPGSRTNPQFNKDNLEKELPDKGIEYDHMRALGGRRKEAEDIDPSPNTFWNNKSFQNYADYALSKEFHTALKDLEKKAKERTCAIMCSEAVWWRCHRRIVSDYLLADDFKVLHIMNKGKATPAKLTDGARLTKDGLIIYDQREKNYS
jgi:uncharacterized protein (DUF488 family)